MELSIYTDGASRGNPGDSAWAFVFVKPNGEVAETASGFIGKATNNIAEYTAIIKALEYASREYSHVHIVLFSDSQVAIKQIRGEYRVNSHHLKELHNKVKRIAACIKVEFVHVSRSNKYVSQCDRMCNEMLDRIKQMRGEQ